MTVPAQLISLTYAGTTVGGGTAFVPDGLQPMRITSSYRSYVVELDFIITSGLDAAIAFLEEGFRPPRKDLTIVFAGSTRTFKESAGTGFNHEATLIKRGDDADTGKTRLYTIRVEFERPADEDDGLAELGIVLGFDACRRRTLTVIGLFTPDGTLNARANYDASIEALIDGIKSDFTGEWDRLSETVGPDNLAVSEIAFEIVLQEVKFPQSSGALNEEGITDQVMDIIISESGTEFTPFDGQAIPSVVLGTATYEACIRFDKTTDLVGLWQDTIEPWIIENIKLRLGLDEVALMDTSPVYVLPGNKIRATVGFEAPQPVGKIRVIAYTVQTEMTVIRGKVLVPVWDKRSAFAKYVFQGPARQTIRIIETITRLGRAGDLFNFGFHRAGIKGKVSLGEHGELPENLEAPGAGRMSWVKIDTSEVTLPIIKGTRDDTYTQANVVHINMYERVDAVAALPLRVIG